MHIFFIVFIPGSVRSEIRLPSGRDHPPLSLAVCVTAYSARTEDRREYYASAEGHRPVKLFVSNTKPYQAVTPVTLARWLTSMMDKAGIDTSHYRAHSARSSAATSQVRKGLSLSDVLKKGNWSARSRTFELFYLRA